MKQKQNPPSRPGVIIYLRASPQSPPTRPLQPDPDIHNNASHHSNFSAFARTLSAALDSHLYGPSKRLLNDVRRSKEGEMILTLRNIFDS